MQKNCLICNTSFTKRKTESLKKWGTRSFCSHNCYWESLHGKTAWNKGLSVHLNPDGEWKPGHMPWNKGLKATQEPWNKGKKMAYMLGNTKGFKKGQKPWNYAGGKKCIDCGGLVKNRSKVTKRCWSCAKKNYRGVNVYNWIGGVTKRYADGEAFAIKKWAKAVYAKDHYQCAMCHKHCAKDIQAHHILSWKDAPELRLEVNNGITLCFECHLTTRGKESYFASLFYNVLATRQSDRFIWTNYTRN